MKDKKYILDVGCGDRSRAKGNVNIDVRSVSHLPENFIMADMHAIPFKNEVFDVVILSHTLEHTDYQGAKKVLKEVWTALKNKGTLKLWLPNFCGLTVLKIWVLERNLTTKEKLCGIITGAQRNEQDVHKSIWNFNLAEHYLREAGFRVTKKHGDRLIGLGRYYAVRLLANLIVRLFPSRWDYIYLEAIKIEN